MQTYTYLTQEQEFEEPHVKFPSKNGFFGPQNFALPFYNMGKNFFFNFEHYDLTNGEEFESKIW